MTQFTREGCQDYTVDGEELTAGDELARGCGLHPEVGRPGQGCRPDLVDHLRVPRLHVGPGLRHRDDGLRRRLRHLPAEHQGQQQGGRQPGLGRGPGRPRRQLRHQPVDVVAGHELGVEEQAGGLAVHPVGDRQGRPVEGGPDRQARLRRPHPRSRSSTARSSRRWTGSPATRRPSRRSSPTPRSSSPRRSASSRPPRTGRSRCRTSTPATTPKARLDELAEANTEAVNTASA